MPSCAWRGRRRWAVTEGAGGEQFLNEGATHSLKEGGEDILRLAGAGGY